MNQRETRYIKRIKHESKISCFKNLFAVERDQYPKDMER